jgi:L-threonylcarbamoyladenylate synthase
MREDVATAVEAIRAGELVVYPTETVYGLGADALDPDAVESAYELKGRPRDSPLSLGVPSVDAALEYTHPTDREESFMREFLPGPVTVVVERVDQVPDVLTAGRDRVGVRVPSNELAQRFLEAATPVTATSANRSGNPSVRELSRLEGPIREGVAAVIDGGATPGTESTVVDPGQRVVHRRGAHADDVEAWLNDH